MLPIPKSLLIHQVEYHKKIEDNRYDNGYDAPIIIKNVLVNVSTSVYGKADKTKKNKSKMIIDMYNSSPVLRPEEKSKIVFNGKEYFVESIKDVNDRFKLHHYEVDLI